MGHQTRRRYLEAVAAGTGLTLVGGLLVLGEGDDPDEEASDPERIDDWQYDPSAADGGSRSGGGSPATTGQPAVDDAAAEESIGLAAGGAADVGTFRRNVSEGYLPIPEAMAYEGLFHDYYFDTGDDGSCSSLFCPTYTTARSPDPLSGEPERYLSVGLASGLSRSDFDRPPLNLVIVLDISGSMDASFDEYYYDRFGKKRQVDGDTERPKIEVAKAVLAELTSQLRPEDRLGVVLFNGSAAVAKPLRPVEATDMDAIRDHIREDVRAGGGTNLSAGMSAAEELLSEVAGDDDGYENRSILLTDAQINRGETGAGELRSTLEARAARGVHTTVIGVGVDFNADLIDQLTAVRGANYYSVFSPAEFERRLVEEFEYMVTPLVYDLSLTLEAEGYEIKQVYGAPAASEATGELRSVGTLFPSPAEDGRAKGGVVLVELATDGESTGGDLTLQASWERRSGRAESATVDVSFPERTHWESDAVRKAVLLVRHANLLKYWTVSERDLPVEEAYPDGSPAGAATADGGPGIEPPSGDLTQWELQSRPLTVAPETAASVEVFREHFATEAAVIGDDTLEQELALLDEILAAR